MANTKIAELRRKLERQYKDSTEVFPNLTQIKKIDVYPSASAIVDAVTGIGGYPRARVTEIFGLEATGKTTLGLIALAAMQKADPTSVGLYLDYEHAVDFTYARRLGVELDPDRLVYAQPEYFEMGDEVADQFIKEGLVDMVVIDSTAAMTPRSELEGDIDTEKGRQLGLQSTLMARMLSRMTKRIARGRKPAVILLNQMRTKIDIKNPRNTGEDAAGGKAARFYASIRLRLDLLGGEGDEKREARGTTDHLYTRNRVRITAVKNKVAPPWARGQLVFEYGTGLNNVASVAELAEAKLGVLSGAGFINYKGDTPETTISGRVGRDGFYDWLKGNPAAVAELEKKIVAAIRTEQANELGVQTVMSEERAKEVDPDAPAVTVMGDAPSPLGNGLEEVSL